jgi:hypothetical protein
MKGIDIFCASQAATAICQSMEQASCSSSSAIQLGGRAIDRHNPIIRDARRSTRSALSAPCSSQPPINPKPYHHLHQKTKKKSSSSKQSDQNKRSSSRPSTDEKKKSVATPTDHHFIINNNSSQPPTDIIRKSEAKQTDLITPPGSTRYLLSDTAYFDGLSDYDPVLSLVPVEEKTTQPVNQDESTTAPKPPSSNQVPSQSLFHSFLCLLIFLKFLFYICCSINYEIYLELVSSFYTTHDVGLLDVGFEFNKAALDDEMIDQFSNSSKELVYMIEI